MPVNVTSRRCMECRRRRRKCDEGRPSCGTCSRSGNVCLYPEPTKFVVMSFGGTASEPNPCLKQERSTKPVSSSLSLRKIYRVDTTPAGSYVTFSLPAAQVLGRSNRHVGHALHSPLGVPANVSASDSARLAQKFASLLSGPGQYFWIWGNWAQYLPQRLGHSVLLNESVASIVHSHDWFYNHVPKSRKSALIHHGNALRLLRAEAAKGSFGVSGDVLAAMHLLQAVEVSFGNYQDTRNAHLRGAVASILAQGPSFCQHDFERTLFYATYAALATDSALFGTSRVFETPAWHDVDTAPSVHGAVAFAHDNLECRRRIITAVPRLSGLMRSLMLQPQNAKLRNVATSSLEGVVAIAVHQGKVQQPPTAEPIPDFTCSPLPIVLRYADTEEAISFTREWALRIVISAICRQAHACQVLVDKLPTPNQLLEEELRCARLICMSLPQLSTLSIGMASASLFSLQMAWATLWRARHVSTIDAARNNPRILAEWLESCIADTASLIGYESSRPLLITFAHSLLGGV